MCLSLEAFVFFLNLLPAEIVETAPERIVIHAEQRDAVWVADGALWCTDAPQIDAAVRLGQ